MRRVIAGLLILSCIPMLAAPKNSTIFKKCNKLSRQYFNTNINDSKGLELVSFMTYLDSDSKTLRRLKSELAKKKVKTDGKIDVKEVVSDLLEKGDYYAEKELKNKANIYYFMAYYLTSSEDAEEKIKAIGFDTSSYPMISELADLAKKDKRPKKKEEKQVVRTIDREKVNKIIQKELATSLERKKMDIPEEDRIVKGSREDTGYRERLKDRMKKYAAEKAQKRAEKKRRS